MSGKIGLSDYSVSKVAGVPVAIEVLQDGSVVGTYTLALDAAGGYSFETSASGPAEIRVKASHWLAKIKSVDLLNASAVDFTLQNGDINGDNQINVLDYAALKASYNQTGVDDNSADLNGDGNINVLDYSILKKNYNRIGE